MALWRWRDAAEDDAVAALLARCADADPAGSRALRDTLTVEDFFSLVTFAQRCVLAALRTRDAGWVSRGWAALAMIDLNRCADRRDVWMAARLVRYATNRLGLDPGPVSRRAFERADPDTAALLAEVVADDEPDLTEDCGMREVRTDTGPILVYDDDETYQPDTDLVEIALRLTALLSEHGYTEAGVTVAAAIGQHWLARTMSGTVPALTGCVAVHADPPDDRSNALLIFVGEAATPDDATLIASAIQATPVANSPVLGRSVGRLCAVMVATGRHSRRSGGAATTESLTPLADRVAVLLRDATG